MEARKLQSLVSTTDRLSKPLMRQSLRQYYRLVPLNHSEGLKLRVSQDDMDHHSQARGGVWN